MKVTDGVNGILCGERNEAETWSRKAKFGSLTITIVLLLLI